MNIVELTKNHLLVEKPDETSALKAQARIHLNAGEPDLATQICLGIILRNGHDPEVSAMLEEAHALSANASPAAQTPALTVVEPPDGSEPNPNGAQNGILLDPGLTLQLGEHSYIHDGKIRNPSGALTHVSIGKFCSIATDLVVIGYDHHSEWITTYPFLDDGNRSVWPGTEGMPYPQSAKHGSNKSRGDICIGNDVWIGYDVKLFKGITIGNGAVIGACSMVNKSVEPYTIVAGTPARPIRKRFTDPEIEALERIRWWDWPPEMINRHMALLCSTRIAELEKRLREDPFIAKTSASGG